MVEGPDRPAGEVVQGPAPDEIRVSRAGCPGRAGAVDPAALGIGRPGEDASGIGQPRPAAERVVGGRTDVASRIGHGLDLSRDRVGRPGGEVRGQLGTRVEAIDVVRRRGDRVTVEIEQIPGGVAERVGGGHGPAVEIEGRHGVAGAGPIRTGGRAEIVRPEGAGGCDRQLGRGRCGTRQPVGGLDVGGRRPELVEHHVVDPHDVVGRAGRERQVRDSIDRTRRCGHRRADQLPGLAGADRDRAHGRNCRRSCRRHRPR